MGRLHKANCELVQHEHFLMQAPADCASSWLMLSKGMYLQRDGLIKQGLMCFACLLQFGPQAAGHTVCLLFANPHVASCISSQSVLQICPKPHAHYLLETAGEFCPAV